MTDLAIPELSLVVLIGASGSGKSTFAARHFRPTQVISSDTCRALVADDPEDQDATADAFALVGYLSGLRLAAGRLTVIDATSVRAEDRASLVAVAREHDVLPVAIVFDLPESVCLARNRDRADRHLPPEVIRRQRADLHRGLRGLQREGFRKVHVLSGVVDVEQAETVPEKSYSDKRELTGPFDVVGDVHGCRGELEALLARLGYGLRHDAEGRAVDAEPPPGRTAVFVGDLVDRGPDSPGVLRLVMGMVAAGHALCVPGNHENKLVRALRGRQVRVSHGLAETLAQLEQEPPAFRREVEEFCYGLVSHYVLDGGALVVAHAGLAEKLQGRSSGRVRSFALYGDTTGETDEFGLPVRYPWAQDYRGRAMVLYGHTPVPAPEWVNNTMCLDTGCVFGGALTALRYPERELVSVAAQQEWYAPVKPLVPVVARRDPGVLALDDVLGKRVIRTAHLGTVTVREENAAAALEVMSRFAIHPAQLLYLPPTMSPPDTSALPDLLEHPAEAFGLYRAAGVGEVVCERKHMGSRAVVLLRRSDLTPDTSRAPGDRGAVWTRTGRSFFPAELTAELLARLAAAADAAGVFEELGSDWVLLDTEILPWSAKADGLIRDQYAGVAAAASTVLPAALSLLAAAAARGNDVEPLLTRQRSRLADVEAFRAAYRHYVWPTDGLVGVQVAPFMVLAAAERSFVDRPHDWHLAVADRLAAADPELAAVTERVVVDLASEPSVSAATQWWEALTAAGGEGMVVKPAAGLVKGPRGLVQPGIKVRGREYLRLVYGPDYTEPEQFAGLRSRQVGRKRGLALREYALGLEALNRLAAGEPLHRIHECVFGVLALESEPVDPRL